MTLEFDQNDEKEARPAKSWGKAFKELDHGRRGHGAGRGSRGGDGAHGVGRVPRGGEGPPGQRGAHRAERALLSALALHITAV